jgi:Polyketide cyclase / dehydrase and lipid transport
MRSKVRSTSLIALGCLGVIIAAAAGFQLGAPRAMTTLGLAVQVDAILLAIAIPVIAVLGILRSRRWSHAVLLAQLFLLLEVGAIAYAINPDPETRMTTLLWLAAALTIVDVFVLGRTIYMRRRMLAGPISVAQLDRANQRAGLTRLLTILAVSAVLLNFEPVLGVVNLAANALWTCLWIPRRVRTYGMEVSVEISASPHAVFQYLVDPTTWPLYRSMPTSQVQLVTVRPPGPLAVGSQIVTRTSTSPGRYVKAYTIESTTEVTAMTPDRSYSGVWLDRPSEHVLMQVQDVPAGARIFFELEGVQPYVSGVLGLMLDVRGILAGRRAETILNFARLKQILEAAPSQ